MKVYLALIEWCSNGEKGKTIKVYEKKEKAVEFVRINFQEMSTIGCYNENGGYTIEKYANVTLAYMEDDPLEYCEWSVIETEVIV